MSFRKAFEHIWRIQSDSDESKRTKLCTVIVLVFVVPLCTTTKVSVRLASARADYEYFYERLQQCYFSTFFGGNFTSSLSKNISPFSVFIRGCSFVLQTGHTRQASAKLHRSVSGVWGLGF